MSSISTAIRYDHNAKPNPRLIDWSKKFANKDNADFFGEVARALRTTKHRTPAGTNIDPGGVACIVLIGEHSVPSYALRRAQEVLRVDRSASAFSHAFLLFDALSEDAAINRSGKRSARLLESTFEPSMELNHFAFRNGVSARRIADYARASFDSLAAHCVPNIALIYVSLTDQERAAVLERAMHPEDDQVGYDLLGQLAAWYSFTTSRGVVQNPLVNGVGFASSAYAQLAYDAAGVDLAPGAQERNTTPEHIWQAARFLHDSFPMLDSESQTHLRVIGGYYAIRDWACTLAPIDAKVPRTLADLLKVKKS